MSEFARRLRRACRRNSGPLRLPMRLPIRAQVMNKLERQMTTDKRAVRTRWFAGMVALLWSTSAIAQERRVTAREVIARIQQQVGVPWQAETVDTIKAGNPDTAVTGIAVTMMATMDVLQRAAASSKNLIMSCQRSWRSLQNTTWSSGGSTIIGTCGNRTALWREWSMPSVGKSMKTPKTNTCLQSLKRLWKNLRRTSR